jgi:hypothetical protein
MSVLDMLAKLKVPFLISFFSFRAQMFISPENSKSAK